MQRRRSEFANHRLPAFASLLWGHGKGGCDLPCHAVDIMRIDLKRRIELLCCADERGKHQHAGIDWVLRRHVFLGDEIHAVLKRPTLATR